MNIIKRWFVPLEGRLTVFFSLILNGRFPKAINYLKTQINMVRRPIKVNSFPTTVFIDPVNTCNLSCRLCLTGRHKQKRKPLYLSLRDYEKIVDKLKSNVNEVDLYNWGEPLLNKDIFKMILYTKQHGIRVEISSNLLLLTQKKAYELVDSGLDRLVVSLHGGSEKTVKIYMKGGSFKKAVTNIKSIVRIKRERNIKKPEIIWRFGVSAYNEHELDKTKNFAEKIGVDIFQPVPLRLNVGDHPNKIDYTIVKKLGNWIPKNKKFRIYNPIKGIPVYNPVTNPKDCFWPWEIIAVSPDGGVRPCCMFADPNFDFGNILKEPLEKIWNGLEYRTARNVIRNKLTNNKTTICGFCIAGRYK